MQKSEVKQKQEQICSSFSFLDFGLKLYRMIASSLCCPETFQLWTESWFLRPEHLKVNSHKGLLCLGWGCRAERPCYFAAAVRCIITVFPEFLGGEDFCMYLLHYTPRLFSAQSFHKSSNINQRRRLLYQMLNKGRWASPVELRYTGYYKTSRKLQSTDHKKNNQWLWLNKDFKI